MTRNKDQDMDRAGRQEPTVSVILPHEHTKGPEAIELYNKAGDRTALDWQVALTYDIMAVDEGGLWIRQKFGYSVPRSSMTRNKDPAEV